MKKYLSVMIILHIYSLWYGLLVTHVAAMDPGHQPSTEPEEQQQPAPSAPVNPGQLPWWLNEGSGRLHQPPVSLPEEQLLGISID